MNILERIIEILKFILNFWRELQKGKKDEKLIRKENKKRIKTEQPEKLVYDLGDLIDNAKKKIGEWKCTKTFPHVNKFLDDFGNMILRHCINTKIFPSVALAQAALESGWGKHKNATLFGIKGKGSAGTNIITTHEVINTKRIKIQDGFRAYNTYDEAVKDYIALLYKLRRYAPVLKAFTPEKQIEAIHKGGYATDPAYCKQVKGVINSFNLKYYDKLKEIVENKVKK